MMGPGLTFFIIGGAVLVVTGILKLIVRPQKEGEHRWLNRGTIWSGFCIAVGIGAILLGAGVIGAK